MVQLGWIGGDSGIDNPRVQLEREVDGAWEAVTTHAGRPVDVRLHDILLAYTPDPLYPHEAQ